MIIHHTKYRSLRRKSSLISPESDFSCLWRAAAVKIYPAQTLYSCCGLRLHIPRHSPFLPSGVCLRSQMKFPDTSYALHRCNSSGRLCAKTYFKNRRLKRFEPDSCPRDFGFAGGPVDGKNPAGGGQAGFHGFAAVIDHSQPAVSLLIRIPAAFTLRVGIIDDGFQPRRLFQSGIELPCFGAVECERLLGKRGFQRQGKIICRFLCRSGVSAWRERRPDTTPQARRQRNENGSGSLPKFRIGILP